MGVRVWVEQKVGKKCGMRKGKPWHSIGAMHGNEKMEDGIEDTLKGAVFRVFQGYVVKSVPRATELAPYFNECVLDVKHGE
jgi:hypothetical protein